MGHTVCFAAVEIAKIKIVGVNIKIAYIAGLIIKLKCLNSKFGDAFRINEAMAAPQTNIILNIYKNSR